MTADTTSRPPLAPPERCGAHDAVELATSTTLALALHELRSKGQAVGLVVADQENVGVVTDDDLSFAIDWAGPNGQVADALTLHVVEHAAPSPPSDRSRPSALRTFGPGRWRI